MPNIRSAEKRMRADAKRHQRNLTVKSELKTLVRKLLTHIKGGDRTQAEAAYREVSKRLDQAAKRNVIHKNTASRKKSRLARNLKALKKTA